MPTHIQIRKIFVTGLFFFFLSGVLCAGENRQESALSLPADMKPFRKIRILVARDKSEIQISCAGPFEAWDDQGRSIFRGEKLSGVTVKPALGGIRWWDKTVPGKFIVIQSAGSGVRVSRIGLFRDMVLIYRNEKGSLDLINKAELEDYLKGVLPFEGNPKWSAESLKAQAVVSRTFALFKMLGRQSDEYDVSSGMNSQVYAGKRIENEKTTEAIEATKGQVLTSNGKIFPAYFHSTCGGATTAADLVWPVKPNPALGGVECRFCENSPHYRWEAKVTAAEIKEKLAKHGMPVNEVLSIKTGKIDKTGRVHTLTIKSTWWEKNLDADAFRVWIDPMRLKSNLITRIGTGAGGVFVFRGRGWGHGVGLCQYGMKYLGELGYSYQEILGYYYPGAQVSKIQGFSE
ncbi:MAG TPA: SpoIID/LytB domain-containing protein [Candidatus Omnitrophota bacterium]|nr:SpoIID/LytB domain-containing protein [Candidatus Omnitrophota bacterium]HPS36414.1 SpoIID/LytB domain-containing protein [Candidatus Omnitrophota bacterium]